MRPSSWSPPPSLRSSSSTTASRTRPRASRCKAVIQHDGKTVNVDLVAADAKKMVGKLPAPLGKGAIVVLTGKDDHGDVISARYVLK